jgi:hypothetical protein
MRDMRNEYKNVAGKPKAKRPLGRQERIRAIKL